MRRFALVMLSALILLSACSGQEEDGPENLKTLRVIGLWTDTPELRLLDVLSGQVPVLKVDSMDFHPEDRLGQPLARSYKWTVCFSLGALTKFECLDENQTLEFTTDVGELDVPTDPATILSLFPKALTDGLMATDTIDVMMGMASEMNAPSFLVCPEQVGANCSSTADCGDGLFCNGGLCEAFPAVIPIPLVVKVTVSTSDDQSRSAARTIPIRLAGETNTNPKLRALHIGDGLLEFKQLTRDDKTCTRLGPYDLSLDSIPFKAIFDEESLQTITYLDGAECVEEDEGERAFVSWYSSVGTLENASGTLDYNETKLTLDDEASRVRLYVSVRDGRNGLSMSCLEFERRTRDATE